MLLGRFGDTSGCPYIEGRLILPRLNIRGDISFLADTGADQTLIHPLDGLRIGIDYSTLSDTSESVGIGGISQNFVEPALVVFSEPRRMLYIYTIVVAIAPPSPDIMNLPSLLGRDILKQWRMVVEPHRDICTFTVRTADVRVPLR